MISGKMRVIAAPASNNHQHQDNAEGHGDSPAQNGAGLTLQRIPHPVPKIAFYMGSQ